MKKALLLLGFVFGIVGLLSAPTYADSDGEYRRWNEWRDKGRTLGIRDWNITDKNCETVQDRLVKKTEAFKKSFDRKTEKYSKINERVQNVITLAEEQEIDVTKLKEDLVLYDAKVVVFKTEVTKLLELLVKTQDPDCSTEEGRDELRVLLQEARVQLKVVRTSMYDIHTFMKEVLKPDLREIKEQLEELTEEDTQQ